MILNETYLPLVTPANVPPGTKFGEEEAECTGTRTPRVGCQHFLAATPDLSHVVLKSPLALTSERSMSERFKTLVKNSMSNEPQWNLYEWSAGRLQLVNILPNERSHAWSRASCRSCGHGSVPKFGRVELRVLISSDGRRIAWTWGRRIHGSEYRGLYVRDMVEERTVKIGGQRRSVPDDEREARGYSSWNTVN